MIHRNILVFILFIVLAPVLLWGQDVMWSTGMKENAKLLYDANGAGLAVNANQVIREIADDMIRPYEAVSIELRATLDVRVRKGKDGKPSLAVSFAQLGLSGDTHFRGFPIEESIKPDRVSFTCCITNKISHDSIITIEASELPWYTYDSRFLVRPIPRFSVDSDTIVVRDFRMALTDATLKRFQERVALINDYYAACAIFDTLQQGLRQLDFSLAGNFPRYFIFLEEMNKILAVIKDKDLEKKLDLQAFDPRDFRRRNAQITRQADEVTALFKDKIKATTIIIPYDSTEVLISEFLSGITRYIRWSMLVSERNSRMYYQYLRDYFTMNAFGKDGPVIRDLVARIWPKEKDNVVMTRISLKIKSSYNDLADQLIRDHRYAESVELLKHAKSFAKINPFLKENDSDKKMTSKAANGIYDSYLGIAEFAIENNKKAMARLYLQKAQLYLKEHAPYVTPDSLFNHVVGELITGNCAQCDTLYKHGQYSDAYNCYREFRSGNDTVTLALCLPNIDKRIGYCKKLMSPAALAAAAKEPAKPTPVASVLNVSGKPVLVAAAPKEPGKPQAGEKVERPLATRAMAAVPGKTQGRQHQDISKIVRMHEPQSLAVSSPVQGSLPSYLAKRVPGIGAKPVRMHEPLLLAVTEPVQGSLPSSMIRRVAVILSNPVRMQEPLSLLIPRPVPVSLPPFFTRPAPGKVVKPARMHEPRLLAVTKQVRDTLPPALTKRVHDSIQLAMTKPLPVIPVAKPVHPSLPQSVTKPQPVITEETLRSQRIHCQILLPRTRSLTSLPAFFLRECHLSGRTSLSLLITWSIRSLLRRTSTALPLHMS